MCGIVGAAAQRDVVPLLVAGLKALEYRGYASAGLAVLDRDALVRLRTQGKVRELEARHRDSAIAGCTGIAHTRWATHGRPNERNAHPHMSHGKVAVVHNGIIENHLKLRSELERLGYRFESDTDTEVIAHLVHHALANGASLRRAVIEATARLRGSYAIAVVGTATPGHIVGARRGSPLVAGVGDGEHFLSSDVHALIGVTNRFVHLEEGDFVEIDSGSVQVFDADERPLARDLRESGVSGERLDRGGYRHYTQKEIFEQPRAIAETLEGRLADGRILPNVFGVESDAMLRGVRHVHIVACVTSFHAGLVARYWIEALAGLPCSVEVASEYRYRQAAVPPGTLFLAISQSGETADTLAALRDGRRHGYTASLALCNVPESSLVRESELVLMTRAGPEIGVASTKAFTTQLAALALLALELGRINRLDVFRYHRLVAQLAGLPQVIAQMLSLDAQIAQIAERFVDKRHAVFLGRGVQYPVALEGALKLKEISYIHAEGYPAGELKHGPLALVDHDMPVIVVAPENQLLEKLKSNMEEVRARGGQLFVFAAGDSDFDPEGIDALVRVGPVGTLIAPAAFTVPLQLLAYHVAVCRGTDVDQPRNLAKSVTVE